MADRNDDHRTDESSRTDRRGFLKAVGAVGVSGLGTTALSSPARASGSFTVEQMSGGTIGSDDEWRHTDGVGMGYIEDYAGTDGAISYLYGEPDSYSYAYYTIKADTYQDGDTDTFRDDAKFLGGHLIDDASDDFEVYWLVQSNSSSTTTEYELTQKSGGSGSGSMSDWWLHEDGQGIGYVEDYSGDFAFLWADPVNGDSTGMQYYDAHDYSLDDGDSKYVYDDEIYLGGHKDSSSSYEFTIYYLTPQ